jgi:hypothetical protein
MSTDNIDPSKKDATISSADDLTKTTNKGDVELTEEELKRVSGGGQKIKLFSDSPGGDLSATVGVKLPTN